MSYFEFERFRRGAERSQTVARIAIVSLAAIYLALMAAHSDPPAPELWHAAGVALAFLGFALALFLVVRLDPRPSVLRRGLGITGDVAITSYALYLTGPVGAAFYPVYLWIIMGNGLRFGLAYLTYALFLSVAGFGAVIAASEYWNAHVNAGIGLLVGIGVLPLFFSTLLRELHQVNNRLAEEVRHSAFSATHDPLTGLANRTLFNEHLLRATAIAGRTSAVLYLDVDRFKEINDHYGHLAGDELLRQMGARIGRCVRQDDTVARFGGDEFCVLLAGIHDADDAERVAVKLIEETARPYRIAGQTVRATVSVGLSLFPRDGSDLDALLRHADSAMYRAKRGGGNRFRHYDAGAARVSARERETERALRRALREDELELYYQPRVALAGGRIVGAEALLRWRHPALGLTPPGDFLPLAEKTGLIVPIGEWVIRRALRSRLAWCAEGLRDFGLSVNVSPSQLAHASFIPFLRDAMAVREGCAACPRSGRCFELEITEDADLHGSEQAREALAAVREFGVSIAIDDFGTGYSSLDYLKRFTADCLKIDRSFVESVHTDHRDQTVVSAVIALAHGFDLPVVAEGVETERQALYLRGLGCDEAQGYWFARPMPEPEFLARLAAQEGSVS